jgi:hypothetical protein
MEALYIHVIILGMKIWNVLIMVDYTIHTEQSGHLFQKSGLLFFVRPTR